MVQVKQKNMSLFRAPPAIGCIQMCFKPFAHDENGMSPRRKFHAGRVKRA